MIDNLHQDIDHFSDHSPSEVPVELTHHVDVPYEDYMDHSQHDYHHHE